MRTFCGASFFWVRSCHTPPAHTATAPAENEAKAGRFAGQQRHKKGTQPARRMHDESSMHQGEFTSSAHVLARSSPCEFGCIYLRFVPPLFHFIFERRVISRTPCPLALVLCSPQRWWVTPHQGYHKACCSSSVGREACDQNACLHPLPDLLRGSAEW